jgi:hypothetical protein
MQERWANLMKILNSKFGKDLNIEALLFLIGMREAGKGPQHFEKEEKVDLMHIAVCALMAQDGYYELEGHDEDGWPHWKELKPMPFFNIFSQEILLKSHIIDYFAPIYEI